MQRDGKSIRFPIDTDHLEYWNQFWEPVILTVWDATADVTYWEIVQDYLDENYLGNSRRKHIKVTIPITNSLNDEGLKRILERTKSRFERFELLSQGAQVLIDLLEERTGVKIDYNPGGMHLTIHPPNSEEMEMYLFGDLGRKLHEMATARNMTDLQLFQDLLRGAGVPESLLGS